MTDLSLAGEDLAAPMQPERQDLAQPGDDLPWTVMAWELHVDRPYGFIIAAVGHYSGIAETPEEPWQANVSITRWDPDDGLPGRPTRSTSWHESEAAAKAAVERTIEGAA